MYYAPDTPPAQQGTWVELPLAPHIKNSKSLQGTNSCEEEIA
jgi:hypothetical protein